MTGLRLHSLGAWVAISAALASSLPPTAGAYEDAGTRSAFALGAGSRAFGLGGAYTAIPGDATIMVWNAGGLGWVTRSEGYAGVTNHPMQIREDFASVVLPSWRWGTLAVSMRRLGTDGIEGRDERNLITDENLSSSESEIAVGYGRTVAASWSLGGVVKLQRQSLAGQSGSGLGADLGVTGYPFAALGVRTPWASQLTWGFALRNVVAPSIRLDQDVVRDPGLWRTGIAYRTPFGLAALDLEKGGGSAPRVHAGAEFSPAALFALRGGMNGSAMTAGAGFRSRGISVDYAFEDRPLDAVHRISLSYAFGGTVAERRAAAVRADEERIQTRLAEAFQRAQHERVQALLTQARERRNSGRFAEALEVVGTVLTLEPNQSDAMELEIESLRDHAMTLEKRGEFSDAILAYGRILNRRSSDHDAQVGSTRCRTKSDRRAARTADRRKAFARAMDVFAANNLPAARDSFDAILRRSPEDEDARAMLRRTRGALTQRAQDLLRDARRNLAARELDVAGALFEQVRALDPQTEGLAVASAALQRARSDAAGTTSNTHPATPTPMTPQQERELRDLYVQGLKAMEAKRPIEALRYLELVWSMNPRYERTAAYMKREYLLLGMDAYSSGRLDEAVSHWERALAVDPTDVRARGYLARAQQQRERSREILGEAR